MVFFGFYLELAKSKGSTKTGVFRINALGIILKLIMSPE
jgi:hypothetical protein